MLAESEEWSYFAPRLALFQIANPTRDRKLRQVVCAVCCTAFRRNDSMPAKAGTTDGLRALMQFPSERVSEVRASLTRRVSRAKDDYQALLENKC